MLTLYGIDTQIGVFRAAMTSGRMHHAWLLAGPRGVGKGSFAEMAAQRLLADASGTAVHAAGLNVPDDHPTTKLMAAGSHPDFRRLERLTNEKTGNLSRNITVDQVRTLRTMFATSTSMGDRRVIIVDSVDDLERGAANALLKSLEEPPASTIFLLVSHQPGRLLPTIRSRCRTLMFAPLDDAAMTSIIDSRFPGIEPEKRANLILKAQGSASAALSYADLDMTAIDDALVELAVTGDPTNAVRSKLAQSLSLKAALPRYEGFLSRAPCFIADEARKAQGPSLERALDAWGKARALSQIAIPNSLVAETVVFEMTGYVATLAPPRGTAKA